MSVSGVKVLGWSAVADDVKAAGYVRVSTPHQKEEGSHERQREILKDWADRNDVDDLEIFQDIAISGQAQERDAYQDMMDRLDEFDIVVVRELSRFGRSLQKVLEDVDRMDDQGVEFVSIRDEIDTTTAQGKLFFNIKTAFNQYWSDLARERSEEMAQRYKEQGKDWGRPEKLDQRQIRDLLELREKGVSYSALGRIHDIARSTAKRYTEKYELKDGSVHRSNTDQDDDGDRDG
jgi:DNA invertase Pin-like site-specific DNA recombinase